MDKVSKTPFKIQYYPTEYERKLIDIERNLSGESAGAFTKRIVRMYLIGELKEVGK